MRERGQYWLVVPHPAHCDIEAPSGDGVVALGWGNAAVAAELGVTLNTVRTHLANVRSKLGARTRMQAVVVAARLGLLGSGSSSWT